MKTKLTLNIDDKIVARAKKVSARKKVSLSSLVEDYLDKFSKKNIDRNHSNTEPSLLDRLKKYTKHIEMSDEEIEKRKDEYLRKKHGL